MEILLTAAVIWTIIGFVLFLLEFVLPGLILFFFALGAWIVAILCLFLDLSVNAQLIIFLISSVVTVLLLRKWLSKILSERKHRSELLEDEFLGKTAVAETAISPAENGKVEFKGTIWQAASKDKIEKGENVIIIGNESILLHVKSIKK
jgi:membrane protein implicated in regulation of membrane protease activity